MKKNGFFILLICLFCIFQNNLLSTIYGKVGGMVKDKDTGKVLEGVEVVLCRYPMSSFESSYGNIKTKTNRHGRFVFDRVIPGQYYLSFNKKKYIRNVPRYYYSAFLKGLKPSDFEKTVGVFYVKEGEIKYFEKSLEKGGTLEGTITQIDSSGERSCKFITIILFRKRNPDDIIHKDFEFIEFGIIPIHKGKVLLEGLLPSNNYLIELRKIGFVNKYIKNINIKKNETTQINFTYDLNNKTGVKGIITKDNNPLKTSFIDMYILSSKKLIYEYMTSKSGKYSIMMLDPGFYEIEISYFDKNDIWQKKNLKIEIKKDITKILNIDF